MLRYHTQGFSGYGLQYSPYFDNKIALATGSNFGLIGNGKLFLLDIENDGSIRESNSFLTQDCLFDVAWNESQANQVLTAQGDGSLRLFDITLNQYPIAIFKEHEREVLSCNWNLVSKNKFVSSSWDGDIKIWSPARSQGSLLTLRPKRLEMSSAGSKVDKIQSSSRQIPLSNQREHNLDASQNKDCVYQTQFSPHDDSIVISSSGSSVVSLFDLRVNSQTSNGSIPQFNFMAHGGLEALCCDFNKYRPHIIATGGVDNRVKIWDLRMLRSGPMKVHGPYGSQLVCVNELVGGHELAIRQVKWSPHSSNHLLTTSYDMTACVWNDMSFNGKKITGKTNMTDTINHGLIKRMDKHTEFVFGADWSLWGQPGIVATTSWDGNTLVWNGLR